MSIGEISSVYDLEVNSINELLYRALEGDKKLLELLKNKTDLWGDHKGSWQGISRPELTDSTLPSVVMRNSDNIKLLTVTITPKSENDIDDTFRLQNTIDNMVDGDSVLLPLGLKISETINLRGKNIKIFGNSSHEINDLNYYNILFTGSGDLFYSGDNTSEAIIDGLILKGTKNNSQNAFKMFSHKTKIVNCTITDFGVGVYFKHATNLSWSGENIISHNFIHYCDVAIKLEQDETGSIVYDSYLENNIIHSCRKWIVADKLNNWSIKSNHFYSSVSQEESRIDILGIEGTNITDNYIELESQVKNLFNIIITSNKGGILINDNKLYYSNPNIMEHDASVFMIDNKVPIKNILITNNYYFANANQSNMYLINLINKDNAFYGAIVNNEFPLRQIYKSDRLEHFQEVRLEQQEYNTRFGQGIQLNDYNPNERCLISASADYNAINKKGGIGLHFALDSGALYYNTGNEYKKLAQPKQIYEIEGLNSWVSTGYMNRITILGDLVNVNFSLTGGIKNDGTILFKLPDNKYPSKHLEVVVHGKNNNNVVFGEIFVNRLTGEISLNNFSTSGSSTISGHFSFILG